MSAVLDSLAGAAIVVVLAWLVLCALTGRRRR
jgi:hypothetical protein